MKESMLPLTSLHRMFILPYGTLKNITGHTTLLTTEISLFNQICYMHAISDSVDARTELTDNDGNVHDVRLITWSPVPDRIVGLVFLRNDITALSSAKDLLKAKADL